MTGPTGKIVTLLLVVLILLNHGTASAQTLREDEENLIAFLRNVLPDYSLVFNSSVPTCQWEGLTCIGLGAQQRIYTLNLGGLSLNGSIPNNTLGALTALTVLELSNNFLSGSIPYDIFNLRNLMHLGLANNRLTGILPQWINLYQLLKLDLSENLLSGALPNSLGNLRSLNVLDLHGNNFTGPMPMLNNTRFLRYLDLSSNGITGNVPYQIFFSLSQELAQLNLSSNLLTGPILPEFNWLWQIRVLDLSNNGFEGEIPDLSNLGQLRQFNVASNNLHGMLPVSITKIPYLRSLSVAKNRLWGPLPPLPWGTSSEKIRFIDCSHNFFSGPIPNGLLASENLAVVRLTRNWFSGPIPGNFTTLLEELDLSWNNFTGNIPETLANLPLLTKLDLSANRLNGSIPMGLVKKTSLQHLSLAANEFEEGSLPDLSHAGSLVYLNLSSCNRNGSIPDSVGELQSLVHLDLSHNHVTGPIPENLSLTTNITTLDFSYNNLNGQIPPALGSLNLSSLDLSFNNLTGEVPNQWIKFANTSFTGNSFLCGIVNRPCPVGDTSTAPSALPLPNPSPDPALPPLIDHPPIVRGKGHTRKDMEAGAVLGIVIGLCLAFCALLSTYMLFHKKRKRFKKKPRKDNSSYLTGPLTFESDPCGWACQVPQPASIPVIMFEKPLLNLTFADLLQATSKFHNDSQIADGRYGPTFKGTLQGGFKIVVKVLRDCGPANELEKAAQLEALGKIRHENLVSLVGYCLVGGERLLVYEFMENADVHQRLHDSPGDTKFSMPRVILFSVWLMASCVPLHAFSFSSST